MTTGESNGAVLAGTVALVTGGSRGLGREMVQAFAQAGADVAIVSRKQDACERAADEIRRSTGRRALGLSCHIGHWDELAPMVDRVYEELGSVGVLVNCAGMSPTYPSLDAVSEELFDKVVGVNLKGPFRLTTLVAPRMVADGGGAVINVSSVAAMRPVPEELPYAAAKSGLDALTAGFAQEYGPTVRVNSLMAGPFMTDISKSWDQEAFASTARRYPMRRGGDPSEIVGAALFLASDASSFMTGAVLRLDGGMAVVR